MTPLQRLRNWTMRLPNVWGLGQAQIHSSLLILLAALSILVAMAGFSRPDLSEMLPAAITLPIVWVVSLAVRVAAQQLALGPTAIEMETTVGPTGNLSTDYEYLPGRRMLLYAAAGQTASMGLVLLGAVVSAALIQAQGRVVEPAKLLDLQGGWHSGAWASQIMWVNLFLTCLHLLPTVPFDMRAALFGVFSLQNRNAQEPFVFRKVAVLVSHLSTFMLGMGMSTLLMSLIWQREIIGWYAATAAAVYLFVAAQWEASRADELEEQYMPVLARSHAPHAKQTRRPHLKFRPITEPGTARGTPQSQNGLAESAPPAELADNSFSTNIRGEEFSEDRSLASLDIDEILRKLHRQGRDALSRLEQEALLNASQKLQEKRSQSH
ncbi:MAG: hypothetical protein R3C09_16055 [Pirellulaceae bacterium]